MKRHKIFLPVIFVFFWTFNQEIVKAEVVPDNSLDNNNSSVTTNQLIKGLQSEVISGGKQEGSTLFHSLQKLNINSNNGAYFTNPTNINLIITRITGNNASYINGTLGVLGSADLFLINPKGIIFGNNSQLDLNGSFLVSTADSVSFPSYEYSASQANSVPLLAINVPTGLNFKQNDGIIEINNNGFQIYQPTNTTQSPSAISQPPNGLSVNPGHSFLIFGGDNYFNGAVINSVANSLSIGAIKEGFVGINNSIMGLSPDFSNVIKFGDINFNNNSFINNAGYNFGQISIFGNNINLLGNSVIISNNVGSTQIGNLNIVAKNNLIISGNPNVVTPLGFSTFIFGIFSNTDSSFGSNIYINAKNFTIDNSATILSRTSGIGQSGDIVFNIINSAQLLSLLSFPSIGTTIATATSGQGNSGNINFNANSLEIKDGSVLGTASYSSGRSGDINIFTNTTNLSGYSGKTFLPSYILSVALDKGNSGNIFVKTKDLSILNGAQISSNTRGTGKPGDITIFSDTLLISGSSPSKINSSSGIFSAAFIVDPNINITNPEINFSFSQESTSSGNIDLFSSRIKVLNNGRISTQNDSNGSGGSIAINAPDILLQNSTINTSTINGNGGIIEIATHNLAFQNSSISASAGGNGKGGNISINTGSFASDRSSSVLAQAVRGQGGNISINAGGIIGSPYISASSELGVDGTVQIRGDELKRQNNFKFTPKPTTPNLKPNCVPGSEGGRLIGVTRDYINDEVLDNLAARPEQLKFVDDTDGGKIKPLIRERGYVKRSDGKLEFIYLVPADAVISSKQNLSACTLLEKSATNPQNVVE